MAIGISHDAARRNGLGRHNAYQDIVLCDPGGHVSQMFATVMYETLKFNVKPHEIVWHPNTVTVKTHAPSRHCKD